MTGTTRSPSTAAGKGYVALSIAFSRLGIRTRSRRTCAAPSPRSSVDLVQHLGRLRRRALLLYYFDANLLEHPVEEAAVLRRRAPSSPHRTASASPSRRPSASAGAAPLRAVRPLWTPEKVLLDRPRSGRTSSSENLGRLITAVAPPPQRSAEALGCRSASPAPRARNLGLSVGKLQITWPFPRTQGLSLPVRHRSPSERIAALLSGEERFAKAMRALDEQRASDDPLNGLVLLAGWPGESSAPGPRSPAQIRPTTTSRR
jgi:hypothetical protein